MATRLKTVKYAFPALASLVNNTLTNLTPMTIYLPESTPSFKSVVAHVTMDDIITVTGGTLTTKTLALRLGTAGYTTISNAGTLTNSGENASFWLSADYTSHFTTNWTGTSMACDFQLQINQSTGTTLGMVNVCVTLDITYTYDDTSATHLKTVMIPLNAPVGAIATTATTYDTIPALDTYLPEASKTYRNIHLVMQGNEARATLTTSHTITLRVGTASVTTGNYEGTLASDRFIRYVYDLTATYPSTAATQTFQPTATVARLNHFQAYLVVTYEFSRASTTSVMNSIMVPLNMSSPMGGTTNADYQRGTTELWIEEPGTITTSRVAFYPFWQQIGTISTLNMRVGTGSFVAYTDTASVLCGSNGAMVRNDAAFTLARGRNSLNFDIYRSDTTDFGWNLCGYWIVNYTSSVATAGVGAHNHTIEWGLQQNGTAAAATNYTVAATTVSAPETDYYINSFGISLIAIMAVATAPSGFTVLTERLSAEGGVKWESVYVGSTQVDPEIGTLLTYADAPQFYKRFVDDQDSSRIYMIDTARRWRAHINGATAVTGWISLNAMMTYHSIIYTVADSLYGGFTGTVSIGLHRSDANTNQTGELLKLTSRAGDGAFSFSWYDNTEYLYVAARDGTNVGRSQDSLAS